MLKIQSCQKSILAAAVFTLTCIVGDFSLGQTVAYTHVTLETMSDLGRVEDGTLVVSDGKIIDIGKDIRVPDDAKIVALQGSTIMPAMVDPYFVFSQGSSEGSGGRTVTFNGRTFTIPGGGGDSSPGPFTKISQYFYPYDFNFRTARRSGILVANLVSSGYGLSAYAELVKEPKPEMLIQPEGRLFAQVSNQTSSLDLIRRPLGASNRGGGRPGSGGSGSTSGTANGGRSAGGTTATNGSNSPTNTDDPKVYWETVKEGKQPIFVNASNSATIAHVLQFAKENPKIHWVVVATGANLFEVVDALAENKNVKVVLEPGIDRVPYTTDYMNVSKILQDKKITFAISMSLLGSQLTASQDDPMFPLAMLSKTGLGRESTLKSVTIEGARLLGIEKDYGSLEQGKRANLLVFDGDPLQTGTQLQQVLLNGVSVDEN